MSYTSTFVPRDLENLIFEVTCTEKSFNVVPKLSHIVVLLESHFGDLRPPLSSTMIANFTSLFPSDFKRVFVSPPHWQNPKLRILSKGCFL